MDFHRNIFYYYRGPTKGSDPHDWQLENNSTKALINVLENTGPVVSDNFLRWLGTATRSRELFFELQKATIGEYRIHSADQRLLLLITREIREWEDQKRTVATRSRSIPDAWIYNDELVVAVESKLGSNPDIDQMEAHRELLGGDCSETNKTWQKVHECFEQMNNGKLAQPDHFLVGQFTQYLEYTGMAITEKLTEEHFDFLLNPVDPRGRAWIRGTLEALTRELSGTLPGPPRNVVVGNMERQSGGWSGCWVAMCHAERPSQEAHITVEILPQSLQVFANAETAGGAGKLLKALHSNAKEFMAELRDLEGFYAVATHRKPLTPRRFEYIPITELRCGAYISEDSFAHLVTVLNSLRRPDTYPQFSVRKQLARHEVLDLQGKQKLSEELANIARKLVPIVDLINRGE
tara:strand:- start:466 stop:1686 length:1221 start_codon:yes stop_codon:yes gene_type:complete